MPCRWGGRDCRGSRTPRGTGSEESSQHPYEACFGLAPQTEQNEIVFGENRVHNLGHDSVFITDDAREQRLPVPES